MGRIRKLKIEGYRSISDPIEIDFPPNVPLVLFGENNAGKSNIVRALDLVLGEFWPGSHDPEDHEFYGRSRDDGRIEIAVAVSNVSGRKFGSPAAIDRLIWRFPSDDDRCFRMEFQSGGDSPYVSTEVRDQCACIVVGADRRLAYQLSFASKYTFLSKLSRRFHDSLASDTQLVQSLQDRYRDVTALFEGVGSFVTFREELRRQVGDLSGNLAYGLGIDFAAYDPSNYFRSLRILPTEGNDFRTLEELGTGQEQILAICFAYAYASAFHKSDGLILVIEEPEAHLHPLAQRWLGQRVSELAKQGVQVLITTHSPAFLNIMNLEGFVRVCKPGGATEVV